MARSRPGLAAAVLLASCAPALRTPPPVMSLGPEILAAGSPGSPGRDANSALAEAEGRFRRRSGVEDARAAQRLFLEAARADAARIEGLLGLARTTAWLIEHDDAVDRRGSSTLGVQAGQLCKERAPESAPCDYALAIALGQQARERRATGHDAMSKIVAALRRAIAREPGLDEGGPHRVLALVYLRAPGWPAGPGDVEAGLDEAEAALALAPESPRNALVLAEALRRNKRHEEAREAYARALALAEASLAGGDPDAREWLDDAKRGLGPA